MPALVGLQYTIFVRGGGYRQAFFNAIAPPNVETMSEQTFINWASDVLNDMHPNNMIMIDGANRAGPVHEVYDFKD